MPDHPAQPSKPAYCETGRPYLRRTSGLVDQVRLAFMGTPVPLGADPSHGPAPANFGVSQVGGSVVIHADGSSYKDGGVLLAHHA